MARTIFSILFWIWGILGFLVCTGNYLSLSGSVGVGTSTYMALGFLYWLGGMMLFGLSALIVRDEPSAPVVVTPNLQTPEPPIDEPQPLSVEKEIAIDGFGNAEAPNKDSGGMTLPTIVPPYGWERAVFFIVIFLLTMLVVYALLIRK